jgi:quinol monooxygenase YgiN
MQASILLEGKVKPGLVGELTELVNERFVETRKYDGCREMNAYLKDDGHTFVFFSQWDSRHHFEKYMAWRAETGAFEALFAIIEGEPNVSFFERIKD